MIEKQQTPLDEQIKRGNIQTDYKKIFKQLHENPFTKQSQKQIFYRLLFSITPTSEGKARKTGETQYCPFCNKKQETEEHIFYTCKQLDTTKNSLNKLMRQKMNTGNRGLYEGIFLGIEQSDRKNIRHYRQTILQLYRDTIWEKRLDATFNRQNPSEENIENQFLAKCRHFIEKHISTQTLDELEELA